MFKLNSMHTVGLPLTEREHCVFNIVYSDNTAVLVSSLVDSSQSGLVDIECIEWSLHADC